MDLSQYIISDLWGVFEIAFGCILYSRHMEKREKYIVRVIITAVFMSLAAVAFAIGDYRAVTPYVVISGVQGKFLAIHIVRQIGIFILCFFMLRVTLSVNVWTDFVCLTSAAATQCLVSQIYILTMKAFHVPYGFLVVGGSLTIGWLIFTFGQMIGQVAVAYVVNRRRRGDKVENRHITALCFMVIAVICLLNVCVSDSGEKNGMLYICYCILAGLFAALILFAENELIFRAEVQDDLQLTEHMLQVQAQQQALAIRNVDLINAKCHDMRHLIRKMGQAKLDVGEITDIISIYDNTIKTGNADLDVILTEKSLQCEAAHIELLCSIDGKKLSFMSASDIFSLFGNLTENAIEYLEGVEEKYRYLHLMSMERKDFFIITAENYCKEKINFTQEGYPETTKGDTDYHGFGTRSIGMIAEKYSGTATMKQYDNTFCVSLIFPVNSKG